jgi:hypothetical protein
MVGLLFVNVAVASVMLVLSYRLATENALEFYPSTLFIMIQAGAGATAAMAGMVSPRIQFGALIASSILVGSLGIGGIVGMLGWAGGDDGGGFAWVVLVGGGCVLSFFAALFVWAAGHKMRNRSTKSTPSA